MKVEVRLFATLTGFLPPHGRDGAVVLDMPSGATLRDVARHLGIPIELERVCLVNGGEAEPDRSLQSGDVVTLFPPLTGGCR